MPGEFARMEELWALGDFSGAFALGNQLANRDPADDALRERLALMHVEYARVEPGEDQIRPALSRLNEALTINPSRIDSLEVRAHLYMLLGHQTTEAVGEADAARLTFFKQALADFLRLLELSPEGQPADRMDRWRLEAARASFLIYKNGPAELGDPRLATQLYSLANTDLYDPADWFFRGLANLELAQAEQNADKYRVAGACFLRSIEEDAFVAEGRYFAADAFLSLDVPTDEEFRHAAQLVQELEATGQDVLIPALKERLLLRARLLGKELTE
ncbi:hypothetical protein BH09SUM1_BH09SUM1_23200 [soil metagenome]